MVRSPRPFVPALFLTALLTTPSQAEFGDTLFVAVGETTTASFGGAAESAGDINDDGFVDIAIGDANHDAPAINAGRVYVYFTSPSTDSIPDLVITGSAPAQHLGAGGGACSAGDFNGDGRDDLAIPAPYAGANRGRVFLFWGDAGLIGDVSVEDADAKIVGESALNHRFGSGLVPVGDLNRDGRGDILVTAPSAYRAYVFFGDSTMTGVVPAADADIILTDLIGGPGAVSSGDFNGDSVPDLLIGGWMTKVYLFLGDSTWADTTLTADDADLVITGVGENPWFGNSVSMAGDLNGDGFDDLVVGDHNYRWPPLSCGAVFVFYGAAAFPDSMSATDADLVIKGDETVGGQLGKDSIAFGDQNADGYDDLILGGPGWGPSSSSSYGRAFLFLGGPALFGEITDADADWIWTGSNELGQLGREVAWIPGVPVGSHGSFLLTANAHAEPALLGEMFLIDAGTGIDPALDVDVVTSPERAFHLLPARPNPFISATSIRYELPAKAHVRLGIYDVAGRLVRTLETGPQGPGGHVNHWNRTTSGGQRVPAGVYFVRLTTDRAESARKLVIVD